MTQEIPSTAAPGDRPQTILKVERLTRLFGGVRALEDYNLKLEQGALLGLIGPNGAGKTTAFNLLSGVMPPSAGRILFRGEDLTRRPTHRFAAAGIGRTFQNIRLFRDLPVLDNVKAGMHAGQGAGFWPTVLGLRRWRRAERGMNEFAEHLLAVTGLESVARTPAGELPYGDQRKVEIARALAANPRLLLLDEPAAGMNTRETGSLIEMIRDVHLEFGLTMIVVEHDMRLVMRLCDRIQVINRGRTLAIGLPKEIQEHPDVIEAYLGSRRKKQAARAEC